MTRSRSATASTVNVAARIASRSSALGPSSSSSQAATSTRRQASMPRLVGPDGAQLRARVAVDHAAMMRAARIAALRAEFSPTQATGTPGGIWAMASSASRPPGGRVLRGQRHADHRQLGVRGDDAGQRRRQAGAGDDHPQAAHLRVLGVVGHDVGLAMRRHHAHLVADAALLELLAGLLHLGHVALGAHHDADAGASTSIPANCSSTSVRVSGGAWAGCSLTLRAPRRAARCRCESGDRGTGPCQPQHTPRRGRRQGSSPSAVRLSTRPPAVTISPAALRAVPGVRDLDFVRHGLEAGDHVAAR